CGWRERFGSSHRAHVVAACGAASRVRSRYESRRVGGGDMTPYPLSKSDNGTKVLITLFMLTMLAAFAVAELNVYDKVGRIKGGVVRRYGPETTPPATGQTSASQNGVEGQRASETPESDSTEAGADVESLPFEDEAPVARVNTFTALLDATHPHVFEMPVVMLVLAHFVMRTRAAKWLKLLNYILSFGGIIAFLSAPWLVRYVSVRAGSLVYVGAASIGVSALAMIVISIADLWIPESSRVSPSPGRLGVVAQR